MRSASVLPMMRCDPRAGSRVSRRDSRRRRAGGPGRRGSRPAPAARGGDLEGGVGEGCAWDLSRASSAAFAVVAGLSDQGPGCRWRGPGMSGTDRRQWVWVVGPQAGRINLGRTVPRLVLFRTRALDSTQPLPASIQMWPGTRFRSRVRPRRGQRKALNDDGTLGRMGCSMVPRGWSSRSSRNGTCSQPRGAQQARSVPGLQGEEPLGEHVEQAPSGDADLGEDRQGQEREGPERGGQAATQRRAA